MFEFIVRKPTISMAQGAIKKLKPSVNVHIPDDLPLPSVSAVKKYAKRVARINALEEEIKALSDDELRAKTHDFKKRIHEATASHRQHCHDAEKTYYEAKGTEVKAEAARELHRREKDLFDAKQKILDDILEEAFAVVRETGVRVLGMRHYDVQLVGGMVLHEGNIAEMTTGEGKTLVATLPAYLNALTGEGVHVVTVNDYLAQRDCEWMGPLFTFHGLTLGTILHNMHPTERKKAYAADITYGTNNEFGFDYLRDNMVDQREQMVQREPHFAVIDEVDSILIDEARTPLIISGPAEQSTDKYYKAYEISGELKGRRTTEQEQIDAKHRGEDLSEGYDYVADEKTKSVSLTEAGEEKAAKLFGVENLHDMDTVEYRHHVLQSLKAKEFFHRDTDYVIRDNKVVIVDEFTGRMMPGRRWSDGLHQSVEAKEGLKIERENQTLASITFQNYFRMYQKLAGMTGTADTEASEFKQIYDLDVVVLPTNRIMQRLSHPDCIYKTHREKYNAIVEEIAEVHAKGQPVLVGTISIEKSELIGRLLQQKGIPHKVLNAKFHEQEASIVAQAGRFGAVTIATNMAGRGTDIKLGGNAEALAEPLVRDELNQMDDPTPEQEQEIWRKHLARYKDEVAAEAKKVLEVGGLYVLGSERHESRRIDNQLRGRSGRQGDPGCSRFFVCLEDDLMRLFAGDRIKGIMETLGLEEGQVIESGMVSKSLEVAQRRVEGFNFEIRKQLLEYDNVMNKQREVVYSLRRSIIDGQDTKDLILESLRETLDLMVGRFIFVEQESEKESGLEGLQVYLKSKFDYTLTDPTQFEDQSKAEIVDFLYDELLKLYQTKEEEFGVEQLRHIEKMFLLHTIDMKWKDHLYAMDQLKEGVGLRSYGQRDPLVEYKREGFDMFQAMYGSIHQQVAEMIYKIRPITEEEQRMRSVFSEIPQQEQHKDFSGLDNMAQQSAAASAENPIPPQMPQAASPPKRHVPVTPEGGAKVGRNEPCPCGSGKKYKKCCGS